MKSAALRPRTVGFALACLLAALALVVPPRARGENWPGWRGPESNGVTADRGAPLEWSANRGVLWKVPLAGSGSSNPIVWENWVLCTSSDGPHQQDLQVIALARDSGRERWHARFWGTAPTLYHETKGNMATPSPVTDGEHVYCFFGTGDVFCLDAGGKLLWQRSLAAEYGAFENRFGATSSPVLFEDSLIVQCDHYGASYLVAIDKRTGANHWKTERPEAWHSWSSPICAHLDAGRFELIVCGSEKMDAFDPRSGGKLWTLRGLARECIPTPIFAGGLVYAVSGPNSATYAVRPGGQGDVTDSRLAWTSPRGNPFVPSAIVAAGRYYVVDDHGIGACLEASTGKTLWRKRFGGEFTASPVSAENRVYFTDEAGSTLVIEADRDQYTELARNEIGEPVFASPAIAGGRFYLRSARQLWCLGRRGGKAEDK